MVESLGLETPYLEVPGNIQDLTQSWNHIQVINDDEECDPAKIVDAEHQALNTSRATRPSTRLPWPGNLPAPRSCTCVNGGDIVYHCGGEKVSHQHVDKKPDRELAQVCFRGMCESNQS